MRQILNLPVDVVTHLHAQDNMSAYVTRLVRADKGETLEDKIKRIVNKMLAYSAPAPALTEDINNSIRGILNL